MLFYLIGVGLAFGLIIYDMYIKNPTGNPTGSVNIAIEIMLVTVGSAASWITVVIVIWSLNVQRTSTIERTSRRDKLHERHDAELSE